MTKKVIRRVSQGYTEHNYKCAYCMSKLNDKTAYITFSISDFGDYWVNNYMRIHKSCIKKILDTDIGSFKKYKINKNKNLKKRLFKNL